MSEATWLIGDVFARLADIPDGSVDLVVTSPPFLALRSYLPADHPDKGKEIGSEATPAEFLTTLLALTREWRRVLAPHGSIAVELGDTYAGSGGAGGDYAADGLRAGQPAFTGSASRSGWHRQGRRTDTRLNYRKDGTVAASGTPNGGHGWPLAKSLCGIPTLYTWSLAYGRNLLGPDDLIEPWRIRNLVVWHRPNPPVGALGDKVRPATSYVTIGCFDTPKQPRWFDIYDERTPHKEAPPSAATAISRRRALNRSAPGNHTEDAVEGIAANPAGAPPLDCWIHDDTTGTDVWTIPTAPYAGSHYAAFPPALPRRLINLMCPRQVCTTCGEPRRRITETTQIATRSTNGRKAYPERGCQCENFDMRTEASVETIGWSDCGHDTWRRGIVLDPFAGSGTTLMAASELGRDSIGIDIDPRNLDLARERLGMFLIEPDVVA